MMITLRPVSVTSLESPLASHVTSVGPDGQWGIVQDADLPEYSPPRGHRKRLKSAGDSSRISASPPAGLYRDSTKKSLLSVFGIKTKSKSAKTRSSEILAPNALTTISIDGPDCEPVDAANFERASSYEEERRHGKNTTPSSAPNQPTNSSQPLKGLQHSISLTCPAPSTKRDAPFQPGDDYYDFPCKFERPQTPVKLMPLKAQHQTIEITVKPSIGDVLQALSGPPLDNKPEEGPATGSPNDDRSPLIDRPPTTEKLVAIAATSFDNIASVTELDHQQLQQSSSLTTTVGVIGGPGGSGNTSPSAMVTSTAASSSGAASFSLTGNGTATLSDKAASSHSTSWWNMSKNAVSMSSLKPPIFGAQSSNGGSVVGTLKKRKPRLSIILPSSKDTGGMRQMSASEDRKIDEAMQLASQLARMRTNDHSMLPSSPRSVSGSSKESLESPALASSASSGSFFFGGFRRRPTAEKKTFVDGLQASLSIDAAERMFTADAQAAYNQLVASSPPASGCDSVTSKAPSGRRHESRSHRLQLLEAPVPRNHQRSFFSESDHELVSSVALPLALQTTSGRPPATKRSMSLSEEAPTFHIEIKRSYGASDSTLSPSTSVISASDDRTPRGVEGSTEQLPNADSKSDQEDTVPEQRAPSPPPLLPPRVPLRPSTVNAKPRQRKHPLTSGSPSYASTSPNSQTMPNRTTRQQRLIFPSDKQRSASEALPNHRLAPSSTYSLCRPTAKASMPPTSPAIDVVLPRRVTRSTADVDERRSVVSWGIESSFSVCSDDIEGGRRHQLLSFTHDSTSSDDSSVFAADRADFDNDPPPLSPAPLPPRELIHPRDGLLKMKTRHNARELGFDDERDVFWTNQVDFRLMNRGTPPSPVALSQSEEDLLEELMSKPTLGRYDTSDAVSYEDLMEFALDGPHRRKPLDESECDEVRLMRKLLSKDVTVDECVDALSDTRWDVYSAIKLVKLNQLLATGLAHKQRCKEVLLSCGWNVEQAVNYLLYSSASR